MIRIPLLLAALLAWHGAAAAQAQSKPDTRSDYLRNESVKGDSKAQAGKLGAVLDINTASQQELAKLPGIGDDRARAIVKGRPYRHKDELVKRRIVPQQVYKNVEDILIARTK